MVFASVPACLVICMLKSNISSSSCLCSWIYPSKRILTRAARVWWVLPNIIIMLLSSAPHLQHWFPNFHTLLRMLIIPLKQHNLVLASVLSMDPQWLLFVLRMRWWAFIMGHVVIPTHMKGWRVPSTHTHKSLGKVTVHSKHQKWLSRHCTLCGLHAFSVFYGMQLWFPLDFLSN